MTPEELNKAFDKIIADLQGAAMTKIMGGAAVEAMTLIRQRITETGRDANGAPFRGYSTEPMLVGKSSFIKQSSAQALLGSKPKRKQLEWRTLYGGALSVKSHKRTRLAVLEGGYKKLRELNDRKTDITNFSYTGRMWAEFNYRNNKPEVDVISTASDHANGEARIGPRTPVYRKVLENLTDNFGEILMLSPKEIETVTRDFGLGSLQVFKDNGLV